MPAPQEERPAQPLLQLPYLMADGSLRHAQLGSGPRETQMPRSGFERSHCAHRRQTSHFSRLARVIEAMRIDRFERTSKTRLMAIPSAPT